MKWLRTVCFFLLIDIPEAGLTLASHNPGPANQRTIFRRLSIAAGNTWQGGGIAAACLALAISRSVQMRAIAVITMLLSWVLLLLLARDCPLARRPTRWHSFPFLHSWRTSNPEGWPMGLRWFFQHLPFMGVQTDKASMLKANPRAKALMWCAGVPRRPSLRRRVPSGPIAARFQGVRSFSYLPCCGLWGLWPAIGQAVQATILRPDLPSISTRAGLMNATGTATTTSQRCTSSRNYLCPHGEEAHHADAFGF